MGKRFIGQFYLNLYSTEILPAPGLLSINRNKTPPEAHFKLLLAAGSLFSIPLFAADIRYKLQLMSNQTNQEKIIIAVSGIVK